MIRKIFSVQQTACESGLMIGNEGASIFVDHSTQEGEGSLDAAQPDQLSSGKKAPGLKFSGLASSVLKWKISSQGATKTKCESIAKVNC